MEKLTVIAFKGKDGAPDSIIRKSTKKPGWSSIMVMVSTLTITNGLIDSRRKVGFLRAKDEQIAALNPQLGEDLNAKFMALGLKAHRVQIKESLAPAFEGHLPKVNPTTKEIVKNENGSPIYYETIVVEDNESNQDVRIQNAPSLVAATTGAEAGEVK